MVNAMILEEVRTDAGMEFVCSCGHCGRRLLRMASFGATGKDHISCAYCGAQNVVTMPEVSAHKDDAFKPPKQRTRGTQRPYLGRDWLK